MSAPRRRRPLLAALLSFLIVGLGDAYNGFPGRGVRLVAAFLASAVALAITWSAVAATSRAPWIGALLVLYVAVPGALRLYGAARAWRDARRLRDVPPPPRRLRTTVVFAVATTAVTLVVTGATRALLMQAFKIPSGAMTPTLLVGDHIMVTKLALSAPAFRPGDIVVFIWPKDRSKDFVKRVVAVGGETIEIRDRRVIVDGTERNDPHARWTSERSETQSWGPLTVPPGHVFMMGDNRDASYDSRFWGPVPVADVKGKVAVVYWSWDGYGVGDGVRWDRVGRLVE